MAKATSSLKLALWLIFSNLIGYCFGALKFGFYDGKCGSSDVEEIVYSVVSSRWEIDPTTTAALLHMQFHDCFVNGCDASLLLDGKDSEKTAFASLTVRGYDVIDDAKAAVEAVCPEVVSCADILVLATRDAVFFGGGEKYKVKTGRRDGMVSLAKTVDLPPPFVTMSDAIARFAAKGLNVVDMVHLLGAHTVGVAHCSSFKDRLYNFSGTGKPDSTMDHLLLKSLKMKCLQNATFDNTVNLDQGPSSSLVVDNSYYHQILMHKGIVLFDERLASDPRTRPSVKAMAYGPDFFTRLGHAMVKMGEIQVLTGKHGEIRKSCRRRNHKF